MSRRRRAPPGSWGRQPPLPAVPFVLALGRQPAGTPTASGAIELRRLQATLAEDLQRLDAACWQGKLDARELGRFQELRAAFTRVNRALEPRDAEAPG